jgi:sigma-B regulation protein RsbU (phosphoserine phosphatase)
VFYTDGITEGRNAAGEEYGEERLAASATAHRGLPADDMLAAMMRDVESFNGGIYEDDATLIVGAV